jgi:hypothetical protein
MKLWKFGCGVLLISALVPGAWTQTAARQNQPPSAVQTDDELARMRDDLNRLESLNLNMSSEIEFLRDQNLQILLRTNSQMWGVLIRDLRQQIDREERRRSSLPPSGDHKVIAKPDR